MMYDLAIIGGGPAGYSAGFTAVEKGLTVILFEEDLVGGTCLNRGCIPTKFLVHTADLYKEIENVNCYGIKCDNLSINYSTTCEKRDNVVSTLRSGLERSLAQNKILIIRKNARILDQHKIIAGNELYEANNILIATGSKPVEPILNNTITSDELLKLTYIPKSMKILGGGVIATEFAYIFSGLGTKVTMCIRGERILRKWDKEIAISLMQSMKKRGIDILTNCSLDDMKAIDAEVTLSALGRIPNVEGIFEENILGDISNGIQVDENGQTDVKGIYAAGDVIGNSVQLAHTAMEQGRRVARHISGEQLDKASVVVNCIYVEPEVASVGFTEGEAKKDNINVVCAKQVMFSNARTLIETSERGFIKLIAENETHKLIGAQLMCKRASDIAAELALAINQGITVDELTKTVHPHPSFCEEIFTVANQLCQKLK